MQFRLKCLPKYASILSKFTRFTNIRGANSKFLNNNQINSNENKYDLSFYIACFGALAKLQEWAKQSLLTARSATLAKAEGLKP